MKKYYTLFLAAVVMLMLSGCMATYIVTVSVADYLMVETGLASHYRNLEQVPWKKLRVGVMAWNEHEKRYVKVFYEINDDKTLQVLRANLLIKSAGWDPGTVESTANMLYVQLNNGEEWHMEIRSDAQLEVEYPRGCYMLAIDKKFCSLFKSTLEAKIGKRINLFFGQDDYHNGRYHFRRVAFGEGRFCFWIASAKFPLPQVSGFYFEPIAGNPFLCQMAGNMKITDQDITRTFMIYPEVDNKNIDLDDDFGEKPWQETDLYKLSQAAIKEKAIIIMREEPKDTLVRCTNDHDLFKTIQDQRMSIGRPVFIFDSSARYQENSIK